MVIGITFNVMFGTFFFYLHVFIFSIIYINWIVQTIKDTVFNINFDYCFFS